MKFNQKKENATSDFTHKGHPKSLDFKGLYFKLWSTFLAFAIILMAILWILQIALLQPYYKMAKKASISRVASELSAEYSKPKLLDAHELINTMSELSYSHDMYFYLSAIDGSLSISPGSQNTPRRFVGGNAENYNLIKQQLAESPSGTIAFTIEGPSGLLDTLVYGTTIHSSKRPDAVLCIFAPLSPVDANVDILQSQLGLVTILSLILAGTLSLFIARRISEPLTLFKNKASQLAQGKYGIEFESNSYTEINELADTLTYTSKELAKADNLQRDLIANVSHDLRTPLTMVKSYAEMIRDLSGDNPEKRNAHLQVIIEEADRLNQLVGDMLILSKMQSGVDVMQRSRFDFKESVQNLVHTYGIYEEQSNYQILWESDMDSAWMDGDEGRLLQVVSNLINNAIRYCGDAKIIEIRLLKSNANKVCLSVRDHGVGIPPEELEHIWERYYKVSKTVSRTPSGSSGLGLSIVKEILLLHNARFGVESVVDQGSTFWFELTLAEEKAPEKKK